MIFDNVTVIIADCLDIDKDRLLSDVSFEEINVSPYEFSELIITLEEKFDIEIREDDYENLYTIGDLVDLIETKI